MSVISELKEELEKISPWPWKISGYHFCANCHGPRKRITSSTDCFDDLRVEIWTTDKDAEQGRYDHSINPNVIFIARSPERIAALVEYVEAAKAYLKDKEQIIEIDEVGKVHRPDDRLQAARKKLGLTEE